MTTVETPQYIKALLAPTKNSRGSRRAWSIDVESVWVPFFTATNVMGETGIADDVLGAPIQLAKGSDGEVRFTQSGRPVMRVHKDLNDQILVVRENFVAGLQAYTGSVMEERSDPPQADAEQVSKQHDAAKPILEQDQLDILAATEKLRESTDSASGGPAEAEHVPSNGQTEGKATLSRNRRNTSEKPDLEPASTPAS
jgi:hypothetical protein